MHWTIAASFFLVGDSPGHPWIDDFVPGQCHQFTKISRRGPLQSWHERRSKTTQISEWASFWNQGQQAIRLTQGGIITVFPQLAAIVGVQKRLWRKPTPIVAWCFNLGACYEGWKGTAARQALSAVDRFVVHSRWECQVLSDWLKLPPERFLFVPLQRAAIPLTETEEMEHPFLLALGTAHRDYRTLFAAVEKLQLPTVVVAGHHALEGLRPPANVTIRSGLTPDECHRLAQRARATLVPLQPTPTAAGQVTVIESMRMGRPIIATQCPGTVDYLQHDETGLLVPPHDSLALSEAIDAIWQNDPLRQRLGANAARYAEANLSDSAAGAALKRVLDDFS